MAGGHDLGTISGVLVPTCENMWGVLIFLRFFFVVGHAGVWQDTPLGLRGRYWNLTYPKCIKFLLFLCFCFDFRGF